MVDEEKIRPGHWLGLVFCVPFTALILMVGWQEGHPARKKTIPVILRSSVLEQVEEEDPRGNQQTQVHLDKWLLNGSTGIVHCVVIKKN